MLKERINSLEVKIKDTQAQPRAIYMPAPSKHEITETPITSFAKEIEVHGFVDTAFVYNTNTPVSPNPSVNNLRVFDTSADGFMLNNMQINLEKPISKESPIGFRTDIDFGQDAQLIHSNGLGTNTVVGNYDSYDLQQAYAQIMLPFTLPFADTISFKVGKFSTLMGAEVIESINNWNYSRAFLFGYAIPFTETGIRAYYKPFEDSPVDGYLGVVNGWDQTLDLNRAKTIEAQMNYTPIESLTFTVGGMFGPERADSNYDYRNLVDLIITYKATDKLTLKVNYDYGWEKDATSVASSLTDPKDGTWNGIAAYAKYDIYDWWSIAGRIEYLNDQNGIRTNVVNNAAMPVTNCYLTEFTLTNEFKIYKNVITRLEYRYDKASDQVFFKDKGYANYQNTLAAEVIASF